MKETRKQIEAQVRNKLAKQYNERLELANKGKAEAWKAFYGACKNNQDLREENERLKEKVEQYEDWIYRLQEFCNLPEDMRDKAIRKYTEEVKMQEEFNSFMNSEWFGHILSML